MNRLCQRKLLKSEYCAVDDFFFSNNFSLICIPHHLSTTVNGSTVNKFSIAPRSQHKSASFLEINGIVYKTNPRKLEKTSLPNQYPQTKTTSPARKSPVQSYRRLIVRGENFLLDASGTNLIRVQTNGKQMLNKTTDNGSGAAMINRIDIGKVTFVKKSNDTYERTDFHKSRYHLNAAKHRSIQMLTNCLKKTNVPCPIYKKLGKCAAFVRGKCTKLHDKKLVDVCPRYCAATAFGFFFNDCFLIKFKFSNRI